MYDTYDTEMQPLPIIDNPISYVVDAACSSHGLQNDTEYEYRVVVLKTNEKKDKNLMINKHRYLKYLGAQFEALRLLLLLRILPLIA